MDSNGTRCFPSIETQAAETGLNVKTIKLHLQDAMAQQWIYIHERQGKGKAWRHYGCIARIPDKVVSENHQRLPSLTSDTQYGGGTHSFGGYTESPDTPIYGQ
jgi:hypothetical protein